MTTPAQDSQHGKARLAALQANLTARSVPTRMDADSLAVLHPVTDEQVDTITCKRRPSDADAFWYWDCVSALCPATDVIGAAVMILGSLQQSGIKIHA